MSRRPLILALISSVLLSCLTLFLAKELGALHVQNRPHPEWLHSGSNFLVLPGGFLAAVLLGMCNTENLPGWSITILVNALIYAIPLVAIASSHEIRRRRNNASEPAT